MATASAIPQNVSLFVPNHYRPKILDQKSFKPRMIRSRISPLASNGLHIIRNKAGNFREASESTALGIGRPNYKFLELDSPKIHSRTETIVVQSMGSSDGIITTPSLQSKVYFDHFLDSCLA